MKVFLSWSGETSKALAEAFMDWIAIVNQKVVPFFSDIDIPKGSPWATELFKALEESKIGLVFLTPDNLGAEYLMFEAGALSKTVSESKVCPVLFGINKSDLNGPLSNFQASVFSYEDIMKLMKMINKELGAEALSSATLEHVFERMWGELETKVNSIMDSVKDKPTPPPRSDRDIMEEILMRVRDITNEKTTWKKLIQEIKPQTVWEFLPNAKSPEDALLLELVNTLGLRNKKMHLKEESENLGPNDIIINGS